MSSPALPVKARHYQHLAARLAALTATADAARATVETAAHQSLVISELAAFQASMCVDADASCRFMASLAQVDEVAATCVTAEPAARP